MCHFVGMHYYFVLEDSYYYHFTWCFFFLRILYVEIFITFEFICLLVVKAIMIYARCQKISLSIRTLTNI
jgi:hypothetical protein